MINPTWSHPNHCIKQADVKSRIPECVFFVEIKDFVSIDKTMSDATYDDI